MQPDVERDLIRAWKEHADEKALETITKAYFRVCYTIASQYTDDEERMKDLAQEGSFGIRKAMTKFDPEKGTKFSTYSRLWIRNYVAMAAATVLNDITVPARTFIDARSGRMVQGQNDSALYASMPFLMFDDPVGEAGAGFRMDMHVRDEVTPELVMSQADASEHMKYLVTEAMRGLSEREVTVIERRKLRDPPDTLEEIAVDLGVTRERVRQIECASMIKMRDALREMGIDAANLFRD